MFLLSSNVNRTMTLFSRNSRILFQLRHFILGNSSNMTHVDLMTMTTATTTCRCQLSTTLIADVFFMLIFIILILICMLVICINWKTSLEAKQETESQVSANNSNLTLDDLEARKCILVRLTYLDNNILRTIILFYCFSSF